MSDRTNKQRGQSSYTVLSSQERMRAGQQLHDEGLRSVDEAKNHMEDGRYLESVRASRFAMEKFAKSILAICLGKYPKTHRFSDKDVVEALKEIDLPSLSPLSGYLVIVCARAFVASNMWATAYIPMSHGYQELLVRPEDLFEEPHAKWALVDAEACRDRAKMLLNNPDKLKSAKRVD